MNEIIHNLKKEKMNKMKTVQLIAVVLAAMAVTAGCSKDLPGGNGPSGGGTDIIDEPLEELPPLDDVDDVCEKMLDLNFMSYCYRKFDVNADGRVSMAEANAVRTIECDSAENFSGIEYFSSLETFKSSSVQTIDLRYNKKLLSVDCKGAPIAAVDLRYNTGLQEMSFEDCSNFVKVLLPSELDYIGRGAFRNTAIVRFVCPDSVKTIGGSAFNGCKSLESVTFPEEGLREIGDSAFISCSALESVTFPEGLQEIGSEAFRNCFALESVTLPSSTELIGKKAFRESPLTKVVCHASNPPEQNESFDDVPVLYVPSSSVDAYKQSNWTFCFEQILPIE